MSSPDPGPSRTQVSAKRHRSIMASPDPPPPSSTQAGKKRKLSPRPRTIAEKASKGLNILQQLKTVTEKTKAKARQEQINRIDEVAEILKEIRTDSEAISHTPFSKVDLDTLMSIGITEANYNLIVRSDKVAEIEALGNADESAQILSLGRTEQVIGQLIYNCVSLSTEAGRRILINAILVHLADVMKEQGSRLLIIPEVPIRDATFKTKEGRHSFGGVVHYMLIRVQSHLAQDLLENAADTLTSMSRTSDIPVAPAIVEAKKENLNQALPQAIIAAASYCNEHGLRGLRGCVTSGKTWKFFVYRVTAASDPEDHEAEFCYSKDINLDKECAELPLLLGLLKDMVENVQHFGDNELKYFVHQLQGNDPDEEREFGHQLQGDDPDEERESGHQVGEERGHQ